MAEKRANIPVPPSSATKNKLLSRNNLLSLVWTRTSIFDFWSISLAAIETAETPSRKLRWILGDVNSIWYNRLYSVTLNLIRQYAVMSVDSVSSVANVFRVPLCDVLRAIPTFKRGFQNLIIKRKSMILIADIETDLSQINLDIHEYNSDSDVELPTASDSTLSSLPGTPSLSARACTAFIDVAPKTEPTSKAAAKE